jgi:hypothetical protein
MTDFSEILLLDIKAVKFALGVFAEYENEEERKHFLKQNFTAYPGLNAYFGYSQKELKEKEKVLEEKELQREKILLLEKEILILTQQQGKRNYF